MPKTEIETLKSYMWSILARNLKSGGCTCRKELVRESKAVKSLHFPNRKRIKGKRGGRKEDLAEARSTELQDWLNNTIKICESDARSLTLIQRIEDWFLTSNHHLEEDDADGFRDSYGASPPADPTPPPSTGGDAEARRREDCLLYTSPSPRDATLSRMPSSA